MSNEEILIKKSQKGDLDAFEVLIKEHQKKAYAIALKMIKNPEDAMDISQEAFIKVYKYIGSFNYKSSFSTWLYRIVVNTCLDFIKKNDEKLIYLDKPIATDEGNIKREIPDETNNPEIIYEKKLTRKLVNESIDKLNEQHKAALVLRDMEGFSYEEISTILDIPIGTVKSRIKRARENLKKIIYKYSEQNEEKFV